MIDVTEHSLTPQRIEAVARVIEKRFSASTSFSRAYLKATLREIRVKGDFLNLTGEYNAIANLIIAGGQIEPEAGVSSFIPVWRPLVDTLRTHFREQVLNLHRIFLADNCLRPCYWRIVSQVKPHA